MPRRFMGIRLLLVFVAINTLMMLMLVTSMASEHQWLANILPGEWGQGHSSGLWVFFSLVLLVNAVTVLLAGVIMSLPALSETDGYYQLLVGRAILVVAGVFLVLAFVSVSLSFSRALPSGEMFVSQCADGKTFCTVRSGATEPARAVANSGVSLMQIEMFTLDQLAGSMLLDAPEVYDFHFGTLANNPANPLFSHFTFAFRTVIGLAMLLLLATFTRRKPKAGQAGGEASEPAADA